ncbi:MAG: non-canonical purine NTP pyrophosphatase [Brevinema sp.]
MKLFIATQNKHKIEEITSILPSSLDITIPSEYIDIPEGVISYVENALIKAEAWAKKFPDHIILSDDSGLEVEYLNNAPGVISSDWAGKDSPQEALLQKLETELEGVPFEKRQARFVCYMLLRMPNSQIFVSRGECSGHIALERSGSKGFGYDPLFIADAYPTRSMAELSSEQKNTISHRQKALIGIKDYLKYLGA